MSKEKNTHNLIVDFGKHKGERWTRLPVSYLKWLSNETSGERKELAESELKRRGTTTPRELELSGHAIDRASQVVPKDLWREIGLHSWLQRVAETALEKANGEEKIDFGGFKFVFSYGAYYPTLKTVMS